MYKKFHLALIFSWILCQLIPSSAFAITEDREAELVATFNFQLDADYIKYEIEALFAQKKQFVEFLQSTLNLCLEGTRTLTDSDNQALSASENDEFSLLSRNTLQYQSEHLPKYIEELSSINNALSNKLSELENHCKNNDSSVDEKFPKDLLYEYYDYCKKQNKEQINERQLIENLRFIVKVDTSKSNHALISGDDDA